MPDLASSRRPELYLTCGDATLFFDPIHCVGMLWRADFNVGHVLAPVTAPDFVRAMVKREIPFPRGAAMLRWSEAITQGMVKTYRHEAFLEIADQADILLAHEPAGGERPN